MPSFKESNNIDKKNSSINYDSMNNTTSDILDNKDNKDTKDTIFLNSRNLENDGISNENCNNTKINSDNLNLTNDDKYIKKKHLNSYNSNTSSNNTSNNDTNIINDNPSDNQISINSINDESDSSSDSSSDTEHSIHNYPSDSDESDSTNGYMVENNINDNLNNVNEIRVIEKNLNSNLIEPLEDLTTNININSLNVTNSDVKIGNTNHINYVIKQYFPNKGANDNLSFESNKDDQESRNNEEEISNCSKTEKFAQNQSKWDKTLTILKSKAVLWTAGIIAALLAFIGICVIAIEVSKQDSNYTPGDGDDSRENKPINSTIGDDIISPGKILRIISRDEWIAQPPNDELADLVLPVSRVIIIHTATEGCVTQAQCVFRVRYIQTFHMESRSFDDIGYNFLVGGDGAVYVGRGWDKQGAHTKGYNVDSLGIAFIGTFVKLIPTEGQLNAAKLLIEEGVRLKKLKPDYKLYGHRNFISSESPGDVLYDIIKKWPHFAEKQ